VGFPLQSGLNYQLRSRKQPDSIATNRYKIKNYFEVQSAANFRKVVNHITTTKKPFFKTEQNLTLAKI